MEELYALSPYRPILLSNRSRGVGDFQVALGGGFWVAIRDYDADRRITGIDVDDASHKIDLKEVILNRMPAQHQSITA